MSKVDWIIAYDGTSVHGKPPYTLECRRCDATLSVQMDPRTGGIRMDDYVAVARAFGRNHKRCPPKREA